MQGLRSPPLLELPLNIVQLLVEAVRATGRTAGVGCSGTERVATRRNTKALGDFILDHLTAQRSSLRFGRPFVDGAPVGALGDAGDEGEIAGSALGHLRSGGVVVTAGAGGGAAGDGLVASVHGRESFIGGGREVWMRGMEGAAGVERRLRPSLLLLIFFHGGIETVFAGTAKGA